MKGQADYRASKDKRQSALFGDADAMRRVLSVRGRTGAVLGLWCIQNENADYIAAAFQKHFTDAMLQQCRSLATDCPGRNCFPF